MSGLRGKQRIYTLKPGSGRSRIDVQPDGNISLILDPTDPIANHEETEKTWNTKSERQFYVPSEIYRSLAKMALTVLDERELIDFSDTSEWLLKYSRKQKAWKLAMLEAISPALGFITSCVNKIGFRFFRYPIVNRGPHALLCWLSFYSGAKPFPNLTYFVATRKCDTDSIPYMIFWVAYANFSWQIYLPFSNRDYHLSRKDLRRLPPWPVITTSDITVKHWSIDLSSSKPVRNLSVAGSWKYTHVSTSEP
jgi:hypothetical protein